jgi:ubiquinone/menaquinone biosynthesis C-methylase UbiE
MPSKKNPTIQTYDKVAQRYFERNKDRSPIDDQLKRFIRLLKSQGVANMPVIDVGSGPGFDTETMRREGLHCMGLDLSWSMLHTGKQRFANDSVLGNMLHLPLNRSAGGLWCCASFLHLRREEAPRALEEFARVLVQSGLLYLSVKEGDGHHWSSEPYGGKTRRFFTLWKSSELDPVIQNAGFEILESSEESWTGDSIWLTRFAARI